MQNDEISHNADPFANLKMGDHLCCIYETESEHRAMVTGYVRQGLAQGEKVIYIVDTHTADTVLGYLRDDGLAVDDYLLRGQLSIAFHADTYLQNGVFDPDAMIQFLRTTTEQALADGYSALRVTGEMTWALRGLPGSGRLIEYEAKLNQFFPGSRCLAICQYDRRKFDPALLQDVIHTHPIVIIGTQRYDNFYFIPPDVFLSNRPEARLQQWIQSLQDRGRAEDALHKSESFLKQTQEITQVGGWEYDTATGKISWTDEVYRIYEVGNNYNTSDVGQVVGFYAPSDQEIINRAFQRAVELGEPYDLELEFISARKTHKWVRTIAQAERKNGRVVRVFGNIMDITKSKIAEMALRESETRLRAISDNLTDAALFVYVYDTNDRSYYEYMGSSIEHLTGISAADAIKDPVALRSVLLPEYRQKLADAEINSRKNLTRLELEVCLRHAQTRKIFWALIRATPYRRRDGFTIWYGVQIDITRRKHAEEILRVANEYNRSLIEASLDPLVTIGPDGKITDVNAATERVTGYPRDRLIGTDFSAYFTEPQLARAGYQQVFREGSVRDYALEIRHRDGRIFAVVYNASLYRDSAGKVIGIFAAARDITERKRIEAAEREQRILAEALRDTAAVLNSTLKFSDVLDRILENVERVLLHEADSVDIILLDPGSGNAHVVRHRHTSGVEYPAEVQALPFSVSQARNLREIQATGSPIIITDTQSYDGWIATSSTSWIRANLGVPVTIKGKVIGFLLLNSTTPNAFTSLDAEHLRAFADQAAVAIENAQLYEEVQKLAVTDALTGVFNRHGLFDLGEREVERALRFYRPLSIIMLDIDFFKRVNDTYGHPAGDQVLRALAEHCRAHVRNVDIVARYGGEEFILLLPEIDLPEAIQVAERLRQAVFAMQVQIGPEQAGDSHTIQVTVSQGVVLLTPDTPNLMDLIARVDKALYAAKQAGRNCIIIGE